MKRMTWRVNGEARIMLNGIETCGTIADRLAAYEDILGDEYELDRLKELVEADKEGRCVVFAPGYPVGSIYYKDVDGNYIREASGVVTMEEYEAATKAREQDEQ